MIDRALAAAKPGDKYVKFGDVGITVTNLQAFRAKLRRNGVADHRTTGQRDDGDEVAAAGAAG